MMIGPMNGIQCSATSNQVAGDLGELTSLARSDSVLLDLIVNV